MYLVINKCVTAVKVSKFSGHYLRNRSTLDIGVLGYIGIVQHKEHSPEVLSIPPGTSCIWEENIKLGVKYRRHESLNITSMAQDRVQCQKMSSTETTERLWFLVRKLVHGSMGEIYDCSSRNTSYRKAMPSCAESFKILSQNRSHPLTNTVTTFLSTAISHMRNILCRRLSINVYYS